MTKKTIGKKLISNGVIGQRIDVDCTMLDICDICNEGFSHGKVKYHESTGKYICPNCRKDYRTSRSGGLNHDQLLVMNSYSTRTAGEIFGSRKGTKW